MLLLNSVVSINHMDSFQMFLTLKTDKCYCDTHTYECKLIYAHININTSLHTFNKSFIDNIHPLVKANSLNWVTSSSKNCHMHL